MNIAGGKAVKSILMAEDIARIMPALIKKGGVYNVCDTFQPTFGQISESVANQLGKPVLFIVFAMFLCRRMQKLQ